MKKRLLPILLIFCMVLTMVPAGVFAGTTNEVIDYEYNGKTVMYSYATVGDKKVATVISKADGKYSEDITIPSEIEVDGDKYTVAVIGDNAFSECTDLKSVIIPSSVTSIGNHAFNSCENLASITFADGSQLTSIGNYAFYQCTNLTSIAIPNKVTSIGEGAFKSCNKLTSVTIPDNVTSIGESAFYGCEGLTEVKLNKENSQLKTIGLTAFSSCNKLTNITIPDSVIEIGRGAFSSCSALTEIIVGEGNSKYSSADGVLFNKEQTELVVCPAGKSKCTISENVKTISATAFYGCSKLTKIIVPDSVTSIGESAFINCTNLTDITISKKIKSIEVSAFWNCTSLAGITIPDGVTSIGNAAFYNCTGLTSITIPRSVTSIGNMAFYGCAGLTNITISANVTSIGGGAFWGCNKLTTVTYQGTLDQWNALVSPGANLPLNAKDFEFTSLEPEAETITYNSITLKELASLGNEITAQYYIKKGDDWIENDSPKFKNLESQKTYTFKIGYVKGSEKIGTSSTAEFTTEKYTPPANPTIDITGKEGGTVIYDRIKHTVTITPNDGYLVKEITLSGTTVPVTDGAMVLENIYGWSRISVTFEQKPEPAFEPDKYISELKFKANSSKTSKGNIRIKVTSVTDDNGNKIDLTELKDKGYTVKFKYYRSTKKASKYIAKVEKDADINSYINTSGKKGTKYYYKVRVMVYDAESNLVAKSDLKQCSYAARTWSK